MRRYRDAASAANQQFEIALFFFFFFFFFFLCFFFLGEESATQRVERVSPVSPVMLTQCKETGVSSAFQLMATVRPGTSRLRAIA